MKLTPLSTVARELGIHPRTLQRWCRDGIVAHRRWPTGRICFAPEDIESLTERCTAVETHPEVNTPNPRYDPTRAVVVPIRRGA